MITVEELRETLSGIPGHYKVWITLPSDQLPIAVVTQDRAAINICSHTSDIPRSESVLYIDTEEQPNSSWWRQNQ